ncbi:DUF4064 domain-containing protein [Staphylococcus sp. 11262D007BW]
MTDRYIYNNENEHQQQPFNSQPRPNAGGPIKRTIEKVLTWIGIVLHLIWALLGIFGAAMMPKLLNSEEAREALEEQGQNVDQFANMEVPMGFLTVQFAIPLVLALIAVFLFKKRILAGVLLIVAALAGLFMNASFIAAILWFIAAIMLFVRKPHSPNQYEHSGSAAHHATNTKVDGYESKADDLRSEIQSNSEKYKDTEQDAKEKYDDFKHK